MYILLASRLSDFYIRVGFDFDENSLDPSRFTECWYQSTELGEGEIKQFTCHQVILGLYVAVHFPTSKVESLTLCEVEVFSDIGNTELQFLKNKYPDLLLICQPLNYWLYYTYVIFSHFFIILISLDKMKSAKIHSAQAQTYTFCFAVTALTITLECFMYDTVCPKMILIHTSLIKCNSSNWTKIF